MLPASKYHGCGNDFIILREEDAAGYDLKTLIPAVCDRHTGLGADGFILVRTCPLTMIFYNCDGSRAPMCGNGIRCVGKYVYDQGLTRKTCLTIDTDAGARYLQLHVRGGKVERVTVVMGVPKLRAPLDIQGERVHPVDMGNPHGVVFCPEPEEIDLETQGAALGRDPAFPGEWNIEFAAAEARDRIRVRVWERGSGPTMACGTGACAALAAAVKTGQCDRRAVVALPGGELEVEWERESGHIWLTGPARTVFQGEI